MVTLPSLAKGNNPFDLSHLESLSLQTSDNLAKTRNHSQKIWERTNATCLSRNQRLAKLIGELPNHDSDSYDDKMLSRSSSKFRDKETMSELIFKKKEMFLIQMSLDTKREEIKKLEEKAHLKEDALLRSDQMLEEDAIRFDAFLKENDKKAHDAIKKAEEETRRKHEKVQELKRLTQQMQILNTDMVKSKELLEECLRYKEFLNELTPPQWNDNMEKVDMYFQSPAQLMEIFATLEEENLFLIQNAQESEQTLEELKTMYKNTELVMGKELDDINIQIKEISFQIEKEKKRVVLLKSKRQDSIQVPIKMSTTVKKVENENENEDYNEKVFLQQLAKKVEDVYITCGFDSSSRPTIISMLAQLESKLESLISDIAGLPIEFVIKFEKDKEIKRREKKREEQQALLLKQQEDRNKKAIERSMQAPKKRSGKQIMFRSKLVNDNSKKKGNDSSELNSDEVKYMT